MKYCIILLQLLLTSLASSVLLPEECVVHCTIHGNKAVSPDKFAYYDEVLNRMDTVKVIDGKSVMTINRSSRIIISIIPIYEDREETDVIKSVMFYIVPDKRDIFVEIDSVVNVSGSKMSVDINRVTDSYYKWKNRSITPEESLAEIKDVYSGHTNDIVGVQALVASMKISADVLQFVEMYNKGGRTVRKNEAVAEHWYDINQYLYEMCQPIKEVAKDGKRYRFRKIPSRRCISIINRYPDDYDKVWQALGNLHLFYREQSLDHEILMAERYGNAIAGRYLIESVLDKFYNGNAGNLIEPDGSFRKLPNEQSDMLRRVLQKCTKQRINDFGKEACCHALADPFFYGDYYNEDTISFYNFKYRDLKDSFENIGCSPVYPVILRSQALIQMPNYKRRKRGHPDIVNAVDMGLSVLWRSMNVGAGSPTEVGSYYAWGEVSDRNGDTPVYDWEHYKWSQGGDYGTLCKYCSDYMYGIAIDGRYELLREDDVASCVLGERWRMPTVEEWLELRDTSLCSWKWICLNGVNGYEVTSKIPGYAGNSIFLPASGFCIDSEIAHVNMVGHYWSSTSDDTDFSYTMEFDCKKKDIFGEQRELGFVVRPVCE